MPLAPGTRIGPYEIVAKIGEGGMGEVYRARDLKLNRDVALKILPEVFAGDPERLARFKLPRSFRFVPVLPRTASGKVQKGELQKMFAEHADEGRS